MGPATRRGSGTRRARGHRGGRAVRLASLLTAVLVAAGLGVRPATAGSGPVTEADATDVPAVLQGDTWLRHHRDDLMPYWDLPEALGEPLGNFPSFRGRNGELLPESTTRGLSTLARQVYGYSVAFMLTGQDRYLGYAKAGLSWINEHARDTVHGGYYGQLTATGEPVDPLADKDVFDLASLGLAYGMYYDVTRDPDAESGLLAVRDLIFDKYYDAAQNRVKDSLTYDLSAEVDTNDNGGDITDYLVPGTAVLLPFWAVLSSPERQAQFKDDLRRMVDGLIARHKNSAATNVNQRFWFWGRTLRFGVFNAAQTDFGHNIKSYAMITNANRLFPDHPWQAMEADRTTLLNRAWDDAAARWNQRLRNFVLGNVVPDSEWWTHDEADQLLASLDLDTEFASRDRLARSAQSFLDVFVDRDPAYPARETFARVSRNAEDNDLRKSFFGKNMLHNMEHALILYLHGQALEGRPARLYYAFPAAQALTAVATPYWFDAAGETRTVTRDVTTLPGHRVVEVDLTGIGAAADQPWPAPEDSTSPVTDATATPEPNAVGWNRGPVTLDLTATDDGVGVREVHVQVETRSGTRLDSASITPGPTASVSLSDEGVYDVSWFAVDLLGNREPVQHRRVRIDLTAPTVAGLPEQPCLIWPPNGQMVRVADVVPTDDLSGVGALAVTVEVDEPAEGDVLVTGGVVEVRAFRDDEGDGRTYSITATATDLAGNATTSRAGCTVPHDQRHLLR